MPTLVVKTAYRTGFGLQTVVQNPRSAGEILKQGAERISVIEEKHCYGGGRRVCAGAVTIWDRPRCSVGRRGCSAVLELSDFWLPLRFSRAEQQLQVGN